MGAVGSKKVTKDMMATHLKMHMMNDASVSKISSTDQQFLSKTVQSFETPFQTLPSESNYQRPVLEHLNPHKKALQKMVLQQQVNALYENKPIPFAPILKEKFEESVKGITKNKVKLSSYLKNQLRAQDEDKFQVKRESSSAVNEKYLDDLFASPINTVLNPRPHRRMGHVTMYAHSEGREPEPERKQTNQWFKGSMLAMMIAAVMLTSFPDTAMAAKTGGRVGGRNFSSARAARAAPSRTTNNYSSSGPRTTINRGPTIVFGGGPSYGYGYGSPFYSPFGFGGGFGFGYNPGLSLGLTIADVVI